MEIVREIIASSGRMLKDKAMGSSIFPRRRRPELHFFQGALTPIQRSVRMPKRGILSRIVREF